MIIYIILVGKVLMYWMVECAMMNKYEYMKMITNMAKLFIFFYKKPGKTVFRFYPAFYKKYITLPC